MSIESMRTILMSRFGYKFIWNSSLFAMECHAKINESTENAVNKYVSDRFGVPVIFKEIDKETNVIWGSNSTITFTTA
jgi:hypothetical protein